MSNNQTTYIFENIYWLGLEDIDEAKCILDIKTNNLRPYARFLDILVDTCIGRNVERIQNHSKIDIVALNYLMIAAFYSVLHGFYYDFVFVCKANEFVFLFVFVFVFSE